MVADGEVARAVAIGRHVWRGFADDECAFLAGAVAYQIFFALLPLLLLLVGALGFFLTAGDVRAEVERLLRQVLPVAAVPRLVEQVSEGRAASLGLGILGTLWAVTAIHAALDRAFQAVFGRASRTAFVRGKLAALGFAGLLALLALLSFAFSYVVQLLGDLLGAAGLGEAQRVALAVASPAYGLLAGFVLFFLIYRVVPRRRQPLPALVSGALVAAVLWEAAKIAFALFSRAAGAFQAYGPLAVAAGLLTWIYLTAVIALLGAEVVKAHARIRVVA